MSRKPLGAGPPVPRPRWEDPGPGGSPVGRAVRWFLQGLLTVGVTWLIARQIGVSLRDAFALDRGVPAFHAGWTAASVAVLLAGFLLAARLWGRMAAELGGPDPGGWSSVRVVLTANLGRYVPGKVWQVAGLALLSKRAGVPASTGTAAGVLVQGFSLAATAVWAAPALVAGGAGEGGARIPGLAAAAALLVAVSLASLPAVTGRGVRLLFRLGGRKPGEAPRLAWSFGPRWLGLHLLVWAIYGAAFLMFLRGLGFQPPVVQGVAAFSAAYLLGYLAIFAPAGIGVREGVLAGLLLPIVGPGAAAVAVLARIWMTVVELVPAGILATWEVLRSPPGASPGAPAPDGAANGRGGRDG